MLAVRLADVAVAVDGGAALTYAEWDRRAAALSADLAARGVGPGVRVGLRFDGRRWPEFAVAHEAVLRAAGEPVPGDAAGVAGCLCPAAPVPRGSPGWTVGVEPVDRAAPSTGGRWLVHCWAPGSVGGKHVLGLVRAGHALGALGALGLPRFDPDRLVELVAARRAVALGLTPALAAAVVASGALGRHDVSSLAAVLLSGRPSEGLRVGLRAALPGPAVDEVGGADRVPDLPPVAVSQEAMVWHEQFVPGSFNLPCLVRRHRGPLDVAAMEEAFTELVRRHEPLRSTFSVTGGRLGLSVAAPGPISLSTVDLSRRTSADRDAEVAALLADASRRPFDLAAGPLFEPRLVRIGPDDHLLVVRLHHTVFDDWSVDVFRRELSALYTAAVAGAPSPLPELATGFTDACRRVRARGSGDAERGWWRAELDGAPFAVQLPLGGRRGGGQAPVRVDLDPALSAAVRATARSLRATPFMTALAAFSVLVARTTGQDDLLLATVVAHRNAADLEPLIGCFTKKVPLRVRLDGDPTFADVVGRARASLLGALAHQDLAFDAAVHEGVGRAAAEHGVVPQIGVVFQGETPQREQMALPGLVGSPWDLGPVWREERHFTSGTGEPGSVWGGGIYEPSFVIVSFVDGPDGMTFVARGVFAEDRARRLLEDLRDLLADAAADPGRKFPRPGRPSAEEIDLRGFRIPRPALETAMARCPGVTEVAVEAADGPLVAYVASDGDGSPTRAELREALWRELPGAPWPADAVRVEKVVRRLDGGPDVGGMQVQGRLEDGGRTETDTLAAMWAELAGRSVRPGDSYWQDFSFLPVLAEAREAGLPITDRQAVQCRTPEALVAAMATAPPTAD